MKLMSDAKLPQFLLSTESRRIIVFGDSKRFEYLIDDLFVSDRIECIIDNDINKQGKTRHYKDNSYKINSVGWLNTIDCDMYVMLITNLKYEEIILQLNDIANINELETYIFLKFYCGRNTDMSLLSVHWLRGELKLYEYDEVYIDELLMEKKKMWLPTSQGHSSTFVIPKLNFNVSSVCNLKCEECNGLLKYIKKPKHMPYESIIEDIDSIINAVDELVEFEIIGGETFLYPEAEKVLRYVVDNPKITMISLTTNGTVIPNDSFLDVLRHRKVNVAISDYSHISSIAKLLSVLEKSGVRVKVMSCMSWYANGVLDSRNKTEFEMKKSFERCQPGWFCKQVYNGNLYICPQAMYQDRAEIRKLDSAFGYIKGEDTEKVRETINRIFAVDYCSYCDYCDYGIRGGNRTKRVKPAVQVTGESFQSEFTIISRRRYEELLNAQHDANYRKGLEV
jgi:hypothetical protein